MIYKDKTNILNYIFFGFLIFCFLGGTTQLQGALSKDNIVSMFKNAREQLNTLQLMRVTNPGDADAINLKICSFLTRDGVPDLSYLDLRFGSRVPGAISYRYWILKFPASILPEWRKAVENSGIEILEYIPNNAYLVRGEKKQFAQLYSKHLVKWLGHWQSAYKLQPELLIIKNKTIRDVPLEVVTFKGVEKRSVEHRIISAGAKILKSFISAHNRYIYYVTTDSENITSLALIDDVKYIQLRLPNVLANNKARASYSVPLADGERCPMMNVEKVWARGLHGEDQIVADADTGLDTGNMETLHEDFGRKGSKENPLRLLRIYALGRTTWEDPDGHGTHTAGSICGNGFHSGSNPALDNFPESSYTGIAPESMLIFQAIMGNDGQLSGIPMDIYSLLEQPYDDGARVENNSWGKQVFGQYDIQASSVDSFIWEHPDMVVTAAAGNEGVFQTSSGDLLCGSILSPGTAKNVITVGASESSGYKIESLFSDPEMQDAGKIASFSSTGPCDDIYAVGNSLGRIKPDVVAPGDMILSTRSAIANTPILYQWDLSSKEKKWYSYQSGTSTAAALTAGACALIRQYYQEGWWNAGIKDPINQGFDPSAALIKATLINGAFDIDSLEENKVVQKRPNNTEGWGRVNLYHSLFFDGNSHKVIIDDHKEGLATGEQYSYDVCNPSTSEPFRVTLAWSDPPAAPNVSNSLVNNLDLEVIDPDGRVFYPNHGNAPDIVNNVEGVDIPAENLKKGIYHILVYAKNIPGNGEEGSNSQPYAIVISGNWVNFGPCNQLYINAPTNLTASLPAGNTVQLDWDPVSGAASYNVYRSDGACPGGSFTKINSSPVTSETYLDTTVTAGSTYSYKVTAVDGGGTESAFSNCDAATAYGDCTTPPTFAGINSVTALSGGDCGFRLNWSAATNNCTGDDTAIVYNVYRSTSSGFTPSSSNLIASCIPNLWYYDTNISAGVTYYYIVRAEDSSSHGHGPCGHGNEDTNTVEQSGIVKGVEVIFEDDFESGLGNWTQFVATPGYNGSWSLTSYTSKSGSYSAHCGDSDTSYKNDTDSVLVSPAITVPSDALSCTLTFYHSYNIENTIDGGHIFIVVAPSAPNQVGSSLTPVPYYDDTIVDYDPPCDPGTGNPMVNMDAWTGNPTGTDFVKSTVDLTPYIGKTIYLQWRFASDCDVYREGWYIDDVHVECEVPVCNMVLPDVDFFNATEGDGQVVLEWLDPSDYSSGTKTQIRYSTRTYPRSITSGTLLVENSGTAGTKVTYTHSGLTNGNKYYYKAFVVNGTSVSPGKVIAATPHSQAGEKWSYVTNSTTLMPPSVEPNVIYFGNNTHEVHGLDYSTGLWHGSFWKPFLTNGAIQARMPVVPYVIGSTTKELFIGCQDGNVYAVDADTGSEIWHTSTPLGDMIQGAPSGAFTMYGASHDYIYAATRNDDTGNANKLVALNASDGSVAWSFDNGGGSSAFGPINGAPKVDYSSNPVRIIFATRLRSGGSNDTLWCVNENGTKVWSQAVGESDTSPTVEDGFCYVGTNGGRVYSINPATGAIIWYYDTNDGSVRGYISRDWTNNDIFVSTSSKITCIHDNGDGTYSVRWTVNITYPSSSVAVPSYGYIFAGSSNGYLYEISFDGTTVKSIQLGDGSFTIGAPTFDYYNDVIYVGSVSGKVYAINAPF